MVSVERFGTLLESASERLRILGALDRIRLETADGLAPRPRERFDRILLNGSVAAIPDRLTALLGPGGRRVGAVRKEERPRPDLSGEGDLRGPSPAGSPLPQLVRIERGPGGDTAKEVLGAVRLSPLISGVARSL